MAYLWSTYRVPETANASLEEIDAVFRSSAGQETQALKKQVRTGSKWFYLYLGLDRHCADRARTGLNAVDTESEKGHIGRTSACFFGFYRLI